MTEPEHSTIQMTPTAQRIMGALDAAHSRREMALIIGEAGTGKSTVGGHYARTANRKPRERGPAQTVWMMTARPHAGEQLGFLIHLAEVFGDRSEYGYRRATYRAGEVALEYVSRGLIHAEPDPCLLIVDEAQRLSSNALDWVRFINDETGLAVALMGNGTVNRKLAPMAPLQSRLTHTVTIGGPHPGDIDALIAGAGIRHRAVAAYLHELGSGPGGLRCVARAIDGAREVAGQGEALQPKHFEMAALIATGVDA